MTDPSVIQKIPTSRLGRLFADGRRSQATLAVLARFAITGLVNGTVYAIVYLLVANGAGLEPYLASGAGYIGGLLAGFLLHRNFTFIARGRLHREFARYLFAQAFTLGVLSAISQFAAETLLWPTWAVIASGIAVAPPLTFVLLRYWVFRQSPANPRER